MWFGFYFNFARFDLVCHWESDYDDKKENSLPFQQFYSTKVAVRNENPMTGMKLRIVLLVGTFTWPTINTNTFTLSDTIATTARRKENNNRQTNNIIISCYQQYPTLKWFLLLFTCYTLLPSIQNSFITYRGFFCSSIHASVCPSICLTSFIVQTSVFVFCIFYNMSIYSCRYTKISIN